MPGKFDQKMQRVWAVFCLAAKKFLQIDGAQFAGSFAFNAFFSLFPVMILLVTFASYFVDRDRAGEKVLTYIKGYVPLSGEIQRYVFDTIAGVIEARGNVGVVAFLILVWSALQCFITLISAANRAWGAEMHNWWSLPFKSLVLLGITMGTVLLGMVVPVLMKIADDWLNPATDFHPWVYALMSFIIPLLVVYLSLSLFYKLAPRRPTRFAEVWAAALYATVLLQATNSLFVIYLRNFSMLNAIYGAFGGIMALLLWIYLSGCIFIFGACLCAAQVIEYT